MFKVKHHNGNTLSIEPNYILKAPEYKYFRMYKNRYAWRTCGKHDDRTHGQVAL